MIQKIGSLDGFEHAETDTNIIDSSLQDDPIEAAQR